LPPSRKAFERLRTLGGFELDRFTAAWSRYRQAYDRGAVDAREYWRLIGAEGGRVYDRATLESLMAEDAACWSIPNTAMVTWLAALKDARMRVALLSNTPREQWSRLQATLTWLPLCDPVVLSYELGVAKPDRAIYLHCLERLGLPANQTLFIDDRDDNVAAAVELGIHAVHFTTTGGLRDELARRFGKSLPYPES